MARIEIITTELLWADDLGETPEPTDEERRILRDEMNPAGFVVGRR